jgi:hypothetical protein
MNGIRLQLPTCKLLRLFERGDPKKKKTRRAYLNCVNGTDFYEVSEMTDKV